MTDCKTRHLLIYYILHASTHQRQINQSPPPPPTSLWATVSGLEVQTLLHPSPFPSPLYQRCKWLEYVLDPHLKKKTTKSTPAHGQIDAGSYLEIYRLVVAGQLKKQSYSVLRVLFTASAEILFIFIFSTFTAFLAIRNLGSFFQWFHWQCAIVGFF